MDRKNTTFEEDMQRLEQIVRAMERGDVPLEESLKLFQEGTALVQSCQKRLDDARRFYWLSFFLTNWIFRLNSRSRHCSAVFRSATSVCTS